MIVLASASPRRKELLSLISNDFEVKPSDADETLPNGISPKDAVEKLSFIKADYINDGKSIIIGADTVVCIDNKILGKPKDENDALKMLKALSGKWHSVFTGVTIIQGDTVKTFSVESKVLFYDLTDNEIINYIAHGEPMDKAGAYGIQGKGSLFVKEINGDYFNIVGLPIGKLNRELMNFDLTK